IKHNHGYLACSINRDVTELKNTKKAQQLSESRFQTYLANSPAIAMTINQKGDFVEVNPTACLKLGYSQAEFLTMNIAQIIPPGETEKSRELYERLIKEHQASSEIKVCNKNGDIILLHSNAVILPDGLMMILSNDITELKAYQSKLIESEAFLNSILDNIPSMITVKEAASLKYSKVNRPVEEYLGKTSDEILGKTAFDLFSKGEARFYTEQDEITIKERHIVDIPIENGLSRDQKTKFFHEKKIPMYDAEGKPNYILSISEDITDQIELERDSKAHLERLEVISKLSTRLQTTSSLDETLPVLLDIFLETVNAPMGSIWLYKPEHEELVPVHYKGIGNDTRILVNEPLKPGLGIPGLVFLTQEPHITQNYNEDPWFPEHKKGLIQSKLGGITLPLRTTNSVIGVINITMSSTQNVSDEDIMLLTTLCEMAGNAIQTISLKDQTEQRLKRLSALASIDRAISSSFDMMVSFEILVSNVISQLK
ncbi:PAS domain S-box protein, partial [bacterium]|nr:PAS domain S-box protein [bacterium]